jgi:hypothetical protein
VTSGIPFGDELSAFAEALVVGSDQELDKKRQSVVDAMGAEAMVDAAGVASNFERMVRIADATGIPLGGGLEEFSSEVRLELGLDRMQTG